MKKLMILLALVAAAVVPSAIANTIKVVATPGAEYGGGGQFTATATGAISGKFQTFCVETQVDVNSGIVYDYTLGQTDHSGNSLKLGTAWLYSKFETGTLPGYVANQTDAGQLQAALWYFQGQSFAVPGLTTLFGPLPYNFGKPGNVFTDDAFTALGATAWTASSGAYGVDIIELSTLAGAPVQSMLVKVVPDGGATIAFLGMAMLGLAALRRRFV